MLKTYPWLSMLALAVLPGLVAPTLCAAQPPLLPVAPLPPAPTGRELPPSAVAPSIERFVREHAASLPAASAPAVSTPAAIANAYGSRRHCALGPCRSSMG